VYISFDLPVSSTNKTDHHDITEILLKVALNTLTISPSFEPVLLLIIKGHMTFKRTEIYSFKTLKPVLHHIRPTL
jgi:hypothetical protein